MSEAPDNHELAMQLAVLQERMNARRAECETGLDRAAGESKAELRADMAKREARLLLAFAGLIGLALAILGFLLCLPAWSRLGGRRGQRIHPRGRNARDSESACPSGCTVRFGRKRGA